MTRPYIGSIRRFNWLSKQTGNSIPGIGLWHGKGQPGDQWVTTTVDDLIALITGQPRELP